MLKQLKIQNIILVEQAHIAFNEGLNILTGETGSGKSAIMSGLGLAIGERADTGLIRRGCEKGVVEAIFEIDNSDVHALLYEGGIDHDPTQPLIIRREITLAGKGRIFINNQMAQATFLRRLGEHLVQIVGQHANRSLFSLDYHRSIIDLHGDLTPLHEQFRASYEKERKLREELNGLIAQESQRLREIDQCLREIEELEEARLKVGEEEELFAEYTLLSHAEEMAAKIHEVNGILSGDRQAVLGVLSRPKQILDTLAHLDPTLKETSQSLQNVLIELQEVAHTLRQYQSKLHFDPDRLSELDQRLSLLNRLKKKYGGSIEEALNTLSQSKERLEHLTNADLEIDNLRERLKEAEKVTEKLAQDLSQRRRQSASLLEKTMTEQIRSLNMSNAIFLVTVTEQVRTSTGDDRIEFFLQPNIGEREIPLKEGASGGELSRVLFALHTLLAGKEKTATLIFDEVDANIGGETATLLGERLSTISKKHQVVCITHFPQVAAQADHHLKISKEEREGRTLTSVQELDAEGRVIELARMSGKRLISDLQRSSL